MFVHFSLESTNYFVFCVGECMAIDILARKIFWEDADAFRIMTALLNGTGQEVALESVDGTVGNGIVIDELAR